MIRRMDDPMHYDELISVEDAAATLGVTRDAVRARLRRGTLAGKKIDHSWFVMRDALARELPGDQVPHRETSRDDDTLHVALIDHLHGEVAWLREKLALRSAELAAERERSDTLLRLDHLSSRPDDAAIDATTSPPPDRRRFRALAQSPSLLPNAGMGSYYSLGCQHSLYAEPGHLAA
jgi:DNA-binding FadR family transcriptional regulator